MSNPIVSTELVFSSKGREIKANQEWIKRGSGKIASIICCAMSAQDGTSDAEVVVYKYALGDGEPIALVSDLSEFVDSFDFFSNPQPEISTPPIFKIRDKKSGLFLKSGSGTAVILGNHNSGKNGKTWVQLGHLKLSIHTRLAVSEYKLKLKGKYKHNSYAENMKEKINHFISQFEVIKIDSTGVKILTPGEWLPVIHQKIIAGEYDNGQ